MNVYFAKWKAEESVPDTENQLFHKVKGKSFITCGSRERAVKIVEAMLRAEGVSPIFASIIITPYGDAEE
jgi:hypothetical protein